MRAFVIHVLIYTTLALVPAKMPLSEILPELPHAIVQPVDGNGPDLGERVAALLTSAR